ncbi:MAG TPA: hypothetical protein PLF27_08825 [Sedimentibacter sp.]|nr:hypothetical protein [Sedimentibacter sp.]
MNLYRIFLYLLGLLPIIQLILLFTILKRDNLKISHETVNIFILLSIQIFIFMLSRFLIIPDGGIFIYFIVIDLIGILSVVLSWNLLNKLSNEKEFIYNNLICYKIWLIAIVAGIGSWILIYLGTILPML